MTMDLAHNVPAARASGFHSDMVEATRPFQDIANNPVMQDAEVTKMVMYAYKVAKFHHTFEGVQKYLDERIGGRKLEALQGVDLPKRYAHLNLRQVSELLDQELRDAGRNFCKAYCEIQKVLRGVYWPRLQALFQMNEICRECKLTLEEISEVLPVNEVAKAAKNLCAGQHEMLLASSIFMGNINRFQHKGGLAEALSNKLQDVTEQMEKCVAELQELKVTIANAEGEHQGAIVHEKAYKAAAGRKELVEQALKAELLEVEGKLRKSEQQEHDYNYRCYGPFKWVWENDVALAKEKVHRYRAQMRELEQKISAASQAVSDFELGAQVKEATRARVEVEEQLKLHRQNLTNMQSKLEKIERAQAIVGAKMNLLLKQEGKESCDHLLDAMAAMKDVGRCGLQAAGTNEVMVSGWVKDLNFLGMALSFLARRAPTLNEQKRCLQTIINWANDDTNSLSKFMKTAPPVMDLSSCYSFEDYQTSNKRRRTTVITSDVTDAEMNAILDELKQTVTQEVNMQAPEMQAIVAGRVEAIQSGAEAPPANLQPLTESRGNLVPQGTSDRITFHDDMADEFES